MHVCRKRSSINALPKVEHGFSGFLPQGMMMMWSSPNSPGVAPPLDSLNLISAAALNRAITLSLLLNPRWSADEGLEKTLFCSVPRWFIGEISKTGYETK